jgi:hypothetical protein
MDAIVRTALLGSVIASSLGAVVLCILVFRYSFAPPSDEPARIRHARIFMTRLGHAFASVCFATTAVLAILGLALGPAPAPPGSSRVTDIQGLALRVGTVEDIVRETSNAVTRVLARIDRLEHRGREVSAWSP